MTMRAMAATFLTVAICLFFGHPAAARTPNDPLFSQQWGLGAIGMQTAWDYNWGGRSDVKVAVLDTGVSYASADFVGVNFDLANAWDYVNNDADPSDDNGHGTHVTATIAQATDNGLGAAGIAFNTTILPIKVADSSGVAYTEDIAAGVSRAVAAGADVINISLGGSESDPLLTAACEAAFNAGVMVVAASGNSGYGWPDDPAILGTTVSVGAVTHSLGVPGWSNWATDYNGNGLVAPGDNIVQYTGSGAESMSGTSMATPHVAAVAALIISEAYDQGGAGMPGKSADRVNWIYGLLADTAQDVGVPGYDWISGYGMVRADLALARLQ